MANFDLRLRKLETRILTPAELQAAYLKYSCTGYLPDEPRLAKQVELVADFVIALNESIPGPPEPTPEQLHDLEHCHA